MKWQTGREINDTAIAESHWLDFRDKEGWWSGFIKWDGCMELYKYANNPLEPGQLQRTDATRDACDDGMHICDIDDMIERLQSLKRLAIEHFGYWPQ